MNTTEVIIEGQKIFYVSEISDDSAPLTVFLHGWGSSGLAFTRLYENQKNFLALDFPNSGKSSPLKTVFTLEDYTRVTHQFLQKFLVKNNISGSEQKIILVGHSFGGRVIAKLLNLYPDFYSPQKIEKIVCISVPFYRENTLKTRLIGKLVQAGNTLLSPSVLSSLKGVFHKIVGENDYFDLAENIVMKQTFQNIVGEEIQPYLSKFSEYSTFCFWGKNDDIIPFSFAEKAQSEEIPDLTIFCIENAGHFPWVDNPKDFLGHWDSIFCLK